MSRAFSLNDGDAAFIFPFADVRPRTLHIHSRIPHCTLVLQRKDEGLRCPPRRAEWAGIYVRHQTDQGRVGGALCPHQLRGVPHHIRQIFITYGELPNARLLLRYGFVEENNEFDYVQVRACTHSHSLTRIQHKT